MSTVRTRKILLIDDVSNNIELLFDMLSDEYEIIFATDGKKGLELAKHNQPDLILLDIMMPVMDFFALIVLQKEVTLLAIQFSK